MPLFQDRLDAVEVRLNRLEKDFEVKWEEDITFRRELNERFSVLEASFAKLWATVLQKSSIPWRRNLS